MVPLSVSVFVALLVIILCLLYAYAQHKFKFWKVRNVPFPRPKVFFGNVYDMYKKPFHVIELERYQELGRIYGTYEGLTPSITIGDPNLLRNILLKDFHKFANRRPFTFGDPILDNMMTVVRGEKWKRIRSVVSPTFSASKMKKMVHLIRDCASSLLENLQDASRDGKAIDCKGFLGAFGMDVVASCAFGTRIDSHKDPDNPFVANAQKLGNQKMSFRLIIFFLFPFLMRLFRMKLLPPEIAEFYRDATLHIIKQRKEKQEKHNDFLQLLLDAQQGTLDLTEDDKLQHTDLKSTSRGKTITEDEMLAQSIVFFLAGHETITNTLCFAIYHIATTPEIQERLTKEIDATWESQSGMDYDGVMKAKYLDAVISETLRLYSVNLRTERLCEENYKLGDTGVLIPKGMIVGVPVYAMHHDPEWFPEPEKFDPERFLIENRTFPQYTYMPFGEGPRNCVGMRFALMELKACLFYLLRHIRFLPTDETKMEFDLGQGFLRSRNIIVKIEPRSDIK